MEQFDHSILTGESPQQAAGIVAFDVLRTIIAARQTASPTVLALSAVRPALKATQTTRASDSLIEIFARGAAVAHQDSFASDEAVIRQDERHA